MQDRTDHIDRTPERGSACADTTPTSLRRTGAGLLLLASMSGAWLLLDAHLESNPGLPEQLRETVSALAIGLATAVTVSYATPPRRCGDCWVKRLFRGG